MRRASMLTDFEHKGLRISITVREVHEVHPHEDVISDYVSKLSQEIRRERYQKDPVIIDRNSNVALDGMHRIAALRQLEAKRIIVCEIDYKDPAVLLRRWLRYLPVLTDQVLQELAQELRLDRRDRSSGLEAVDKHLSPLALLRNTDAYVSRLTFTDLLGVYELVRIFDRCIQSHHLRYDSLPEELAFEKSLHGGATLYVPALRKEDIVSIVSKGALLPAKTTRHVMPIRPMGIFFPLKHLTSPDGASALAQLENILSSSEPKVIPAGTFYEERFYEEPLLIIRQGPWSQ